jgi:hypothetical protein
MPTTRIARFLRLVVKMRCSDTLRISHWNPNTFAQGCSGLNLAPEPNCLPKCVPYKAHSVCCQPPTPGSDPDSSPGYHRRTYWAVCNFPTFVEGSTGSARVAPDAG